MKAVSSTIMGIPSSIVLVLIGLVVALWGLQLSRILTSILFGGFLGLLLWKISMATLGSLLVSVALLIVGFMLGVAIGFILLRLAISILLAYMIASAVVSEPLALFVLVLILAAMFYVLSKIILPAFFAALGATMIYRGLVGVGLNTWFAMLLCVLVAIVGYYNQVKRAI